MNDQYFLDKGFIKNGEDIYIYKNFITEKELSIIVPILDEYRVNNKYNKDMIGTPSENRVTEEIKELSFIPERLKNLFSKEYTVNNSLSINVLSIGDCWGEHSDNHNFLEKRIKSKMLRDGDLYEILNDSRYGIVVYFNKVEEGGELFYSSQNITYIPTPGDLVIHSAENNCSHQVNKVIKGYRYSYSNHLGINIKVPK
jgi:hypothetical protein